MKTIFIGSELYLKIVLSKLEFFIENQKYFVNSPSGKWKRIYFYDSFFV